MNSALSTIPASGLTHTAGDLVIRLFQTPQAGIVIQARQSGAFLSELASRHNFAGDALSRFDDLVQQYPGNPSAN